MLRYGFKWNARPKFRAPVREVTETKARTLWDKGEHVSISKVDVEGGVPDYTIVSSDNGMNVVIQHYNTPGSLIQQLHFQPGPDDGTIFLTNVLTYTYPDGETYYSVGGHTSSREILFKPDGYARTWSSNRSGATEQVDEYRDVDVSGFTLPALRWGDWDRLGYWHPDTLPE